MRRASSFGTALFPPATNADRLSDCLASKCGGSDLPAFTPVGPFCRVPVGPFAELKCDALQPSIQPSTVRASTEPTCVAIPSFKTACDVMKRSFVIDEVMLDGVSGEVGGTVHMDAHAGTIDRVQCEWFCFRCDDTDSPTVLTESQQACTREIVERLLACERDLAHDSSAIRASAEAYSPPRRVSESTRVLARYLESGGNEQPSRARQQRAQ